MLVFHISSLFFQRNVLVFGGSGSTEHFGRGYNHCGFFPLPLSRLVAPIPSSTLSSRAPLVAAGCKEQQNNRVVAESLYRRSTSRGGFLALPGTLSGEGPGKFLAEPLRIAGIFQPGALARTDKRGTRPRLRAVVSDQPGGLAELLKQSVGKGKLDNFLL